MFYKETVVAHRVPVLIVVSVYVVEVVIAVFRYGRISSFHTFLVRVAASALGIFVLSLFFWRYVDWIFYPAIGLGVLAYSEELLIVLLLAEWTSDVGGLYRAWNIAEMSIAPYRRNGNRAGVEGTKHAQRESDDARLSSADRV